MKRVLSTLLLSLMLFTNMIMPSHVQAVGKVMPSKAGCSEKAMNLKLEQRKLWQDHVLWTRNFVISDLAGLQDKDKVLERLLKVQDDTGASIKPYYGEEAGNMLAKLLREHIVLAGQVVDAAKAGKKDDLEKYNKLWYENADKIAAFLSAANPNWSDKQLKDILYRHLQLTTDEAVARINNKWTADIEAYDKGEDHILVLADAITEGIIKQFPQKFK